MDVILDLIATHETYFFREESQLSAFTDEIIPESDEIGKRVSNASDLVRRLFVRRGTLYDCDSLQAAAATAKLEHRNLRKRHIPENDSGFPTRSLW